MTTIYTPRHTTITGASLTGSSGASNRTYTLPYTGLVSPDFQVQISGTLLQPTVNYTLAGTSPEAVTFLQAVDNSEPIDFWYYTAGVGAGETDSNYTSELLVEGYLRTTFDDTTTPSSSDIATWISWAKDEIDGQIQSSFGTALAADEYHDYNEHTTVESVDSHFSWSAVTRIEPWGLISNDTLPLKHNPVVSVSSVYKNTAEITGSENWQLLTEGAGNDFLVDYTTGRLAFIKNYPRYGKRSIKATYVYGYGTVPKMVEKLATLLVAREVIRSASNLSVNNEGGDITVGPIRVTEPSNYSISYLKNMDEEIDRCWKSVGSQKTKLI